MPSGAIRKSAGRAAVEWKTSTSRLAETGREAGAVAPDDEFAGGLAIVLRGLAG